LCLVFSLVSLTICALTFGEPQRGQYIKKPPDLNFWKV
jgi:hypothetical protein